MSRAKGITRRGFVLGSAVIAGGVAFGAYTLRKPHPNPLARDLAPGEATFNPWIRISPQGITLIAPHTDLGQGARSVQAALIAEEMDLEFGQFEVEPGPPSPAYWNRAMVHDSVPFMPQDDSLAARAARRVTGSMFKLNGVQATGGSSTVADSWTRLRSAGATARETLKEAAARRAGVARDSLRTDSAAVLLPDGSRIPYTELAREAADIEPVTDVPLREPGQWRLLGKPMQRLDIRDKSTGALKFGIDYMPDGLINASVRFNPRQGGALLSYDAAAARQKPGVMKVLEVSNGVAVLADNTWNAIQGVNAVACEWGEAPFPPEMPAHWETLAAAFSEEYLDKEWRHDGDVALALHDADGAETLVYRAPYVGHAPLEPLNATILVEQDRADIWVAHQFPIQAQQLVAQITGLPQEAVHLHNQYCGGSFGHRLEFENVRYAAEIGRQMPGTPIKLTFSREEDFAHEFPRQIGMARVRGRVSAGAVDALDIEIATPSVMASQTARAGLSVPGPDLQIPAGAWNAPYAIPNLRVRAYRAPPLAPVSSWRSVGASTAGFFLESGLDELIHKAGADPLAERLRLCNDRLSRRVLEAVAEMADWGSPMAAGSGRGVALVHSFGTPVAEVVEVSQGESGLRVERVYVAAAVGRVIDPVNFENQVQGGVVWGLGHAINCEITYADGMAEQRNYHAHAGMRLHQCPQIEVRAIESDDRVRGIGEPPVPPAAPALANAIFAATGQRLREMPFAKFVRFA